MKTLRLGSRGSALALWQARWVVAQLEAAWQGREDLTVELVTFKTEGDRRQDISLQSKNSAGLFTSELEAALLNGSIDCAIHSLKDLPTQLPTGLAIGAYCKREDPRDVLVSKGNVSLADLPAGAHVGTSSLRRTAQVLRINPGLVCVDIRGSVETRLSTMQESQNLDALILAAAGLIRLGKQNAISHFLPLDEFLPAPAQGVVAVEIRYDQQDVALLLKRINDESAQLEACAERSFLDALEGKYTMPIAAHATSTPQELALVGMVASLDGSEAVRVNTRQKFPYFNADLLGKAAATQALQNGAQALLVPFTLH